MAHVDAAEKLVVEHLALVQHIVSSLSARYPRHVDRNDLWNAGALGLVEASRRYDETAGIPFARYAAIRVRGAIIDSTRSRDWATRAVRRDLRAIHAAEEDLRGRGSEITDELVSKALDMPIDELRKRRSDEIAATLLYLDHDGDDSSMSLKDSVVDHDTLCRPDTALESRELIGTLYQAVEKLPEPQRTVVARYYIDGDLMQDIAEDLGVTEARVSQIRSEALSSIRAYFATLYDEVQPDEDDTPGKRARARYLEAMDDSTWRTRLEAATSRVAG